MRYSLATLTRRATKPRRTEIALPKIVPPATMASNLYASSYALVVAAWESAIPSILADYERALAAMSTDSPADLGARIGSVERDIESVMVRVRLALGVWAASVEKWHRTKWRGAVLTATKVDIGTLIGAGDMRMTTGAAIERNVGLVKSVSDQARGRISDAVFRGLRERKTADAVAKDIRDATDMGRRRARNIASDQLNKIASELASERRREAGIDTWEWVHSGKLHPRPEHIARNGKRYSDNPDDGAPPPEDRPGDWPFCGCTERAVLSLDSKF